MTPARGLTPPCSPLTSSISSISSPPPPQDYGHIVRTIQRRSADRLSGDHGAASWRLRTDSAGSGTEGEIEPNSLEEDLRLAAEIGVALLQEKAVLQQRVESIEKANQKLLHRLSGSVKENNQLQRRLEETVGNLEQADSSNRALLVSLEEDRKTISRLSAESGKLVATSTNLQNLQRTHQDTLEELVSERKRASAAESKVRRVTERANELEERLRTAIADLEEMRQDKVLRSRKSGEALAKVRAKLARGEDTSDDRTAAGGGARAESIKNVETDELLKLVETLVTENNLLRSESLELHGLLESTREEQTDLRSTMAERDVVPEEDEEDVRRAENDEDDVPTRFEHRRLSMFSATSAPPEGIASPSLSQSGFDIDSQRVPMSPGSNSLRGRRPPPVSSNSTGALNTAKVPFGRSKGHNRRSLSMDISSSAQSGQGPSPLVDPHNVPDSPNPYYSPSSNRPASIFSNASEDPDSSTRPRRHHRPLSLSLGPSLFPGVPEDDASRPVSPFTRAPAPAHRRRASQALLANSESVTDSLASAQSGLGISASHFAPSVDSGTQTTPPSSPLHAPRPDLPSFTQPFSDTSTPHRSPHSHPYRSPSLSPKPTSARSHASVSELSEERLFEAQVVHGAGVQEQRTAALGQLLEHVAKLLGRLQTADVATQTKRLAKQNLPGGDVKHVAQANLKDLVTEIDSMRDRFRRILEQERSTLAKDTPRAASHSSSESLISRREFVSLVKLLRDLLFEASRLRSLVNRVQLEPSLASRLGELDDAQTGASETTDQATSKSASTAGGLLAPLSRLFGSTLSPGEHPTLISRPSSAQLRAPPKRGGYSAVTSATVNVEFGKAAVRSSSTDPTTTSPSQTPVSRPDPPRRDLSSIFAGSTARPADPWVVLPNGDGPSGATPAPMPQPRRAPSRSPGLASVASSYLPFSRILASSYRPALSSTTNAVLDSIPHAPPTSHDPSASNEPPPTLLERQLRPRGLSDSSIRSTFLSHGIANPHHRVLTPATLALSSEPTRVATSAVVADSTSALSTNPGSSSFVAPSGLGAISALQKQLQADEGLLSAPNSGGSLSRRSSATNLRAKPSQSRLRDQVVPPAAPASGPVSIDRETPYPTTTSASSVSTTPSLATPSAHVTVSTSPGPIQISPPSPMKRSTPSHRSTDSTSSSSPVERGTAPNSLFGTLASGWASGWTSANAETMPQSYKERTRLGRD
ncbi:hypothetical protein JCM11491_002793 [Sporobolomyces phaffii]